MNEENIINALNAYDGTQPSLEKTVDVLATEIGPDWMDKAFEQLGDLPVELKEKLDHAFNYYASLTAWQEAQSYLEQEEPLEADVMEERLPVLKHWLDFFGQPGQDLYQQLEDRYQSQSDTSSESGSAPESSGGDVSSEITVSKPDLPEEVDAEQPVQVSAGVSQGEIEENSQGIEPAEDEQPVSEEEVLEGGSLPEIADQGVQQTEGIPETTNLEEDDTPEGFVVRKAEHEIALLDDLQSWLAARCLQLGDIETFAYPYYGMLVDLMRQVVKDIQAVLDLENQDIVSQYYPDGLDPLIRKKEAVEADIQTAVENCESDTTALIEEGMDLNKVKKALGDLDNSTEKEYLGPAPDGFELLDDDKPIDEQAVREQYEQLEENAQKEVQKQDISVTDEKSASQKEQNGVQRKLSFSLKPKKG